MKKIFTKFFLFAALLVASTNLSAQTYNGGTWYSLYETGERTLNTIDSETLNAFTPVGTNLTFDAKRAATGQGNLKVAPIVNGQQQSDIFDQKPGKVTKKNFLGIESQVDYTDAPYSATVSNSNSNQIKFYTVTGATLNKYFKNVKLPLANHILLPDGIYGKNTDSKSFGSVTIDGQSAAQKVTLRSFLTAGNITVTSSDNAFRINSASNLSGLTYAVGANACASANGQSGAQAGGATLGDINQYAFDIYFCPTEAKEYSATITITDGTSTATVTVTGTGLKKNQILNWSDKYADKKLSVGQQVSDLASAIGGAITYASSNDTIIAIINDGAGIQALAAGEATIYATQAGNEQWNEVTDSIVLTVMDKQVQYIHWTDNLNRLTLGQDTAVVLTAVAQVMQGEEYVDMPERSALITYQTADSSVVIVEGDTLIVVGEGETTLTATLPGDEYYEAAQLSMSVRVRVPSTLCETYVLEATDEFSIEYSVVWQERIYEPAAFSGPGHVLTFQARKERGEAVGNIEIQQYVNGAWQTIDDANPGTDWRDYWYELDRNATKIRFYNGYGSYDRYFKNVLVTQATYLETTTPAISVVKSVGDPISEPIQIQYSNLPDEVIITHTSTLTQLSDAQIDCTCGDYGDKTITLTAQPYAPGVILDTVVISNTTLGVTLTIPVTITVQRYNQVIEWNDNVDNIVATDTVPAFTATAHNEVTYSTSDSAVAYVDSLNQLVIMSAGVVTITAHAAESETHEAAELSKTFEIYKAAQTINWALEADTISIGDSLYLSELTTALATSGLEVVYEYSEDWSSYVTFNDSTGLITAIAEGTITITAKQTGNHIYQEAEQLYATLTIVEDGADDDDISTALDNINAFEDKTIKAIINGQIVIIRGEQMYDLQGRVIR